MPVNGNIPVARSKLPPGDAGVDRTVQKMVEVARGKYGAKSPKVRALAIDIVRNAGVPEKEYGREAVAIFEWVRDNIRYVKDPIGQETLSHPEELIFNSRAGDCLHEDTLLLTPNGYVRIADIRPGDTIYGKDGWTKVVSFWDKGVLDTKAYNLDNGGFFVATDEHLCFDAEGVEVQAKDLTEGDFLLQHDRLEAGGLNNWTQDHCYFLGLYLADGWMDGNRVCIAGKDGHPKEKQKHWVRQFAEKMGFGVSWHSRYIRVYAPSWIDFLGKGTAVDKSIDWSLLHSLNEDQCRALLRGLLADSHQPKDRRSGLCFSSISKEMALQVRYLYRRIGVSCRITQVDDHGGLGDNPIYRVYPRLYRPKAAKITSIEPSGPSHVYDIETEDHGIYLPEADVIVHNCDDKTIAVMALLGSLGIMSYPVVVGTNPQTFTHVYLHAVIPPGKHALAGQVVPMDPIMKWPAGREAQAPKVKRKKVYPQYAGMSGVGSLNMDHSMLPGMGEYVSAPSYLDTEDSQARQLLAQGSAGGTRQVSASRSGMVNSQGTLATTTKSVQGMGGVDGMFVVTDNMIQEDVAVGPDRVTQSQQDRYGRLFNRAPQPRDARNTGPLGPITARSATLSTKVLESERAVEIPTLAKADQATQRKRSFGQKKIVAIKNGNIDQVHLNTRGNVAIDPPKQDVAFGGLEGDVPRAAMRKTRVMYQGPRRDATAPRALNRMYQKNIQSQTEVKLDAATPQAIPSYAKYRNLAYGAGLAGFSDTTNKLLLGAVALGGLFLLMKNRG
jgi:hypothetical protein